MQQTIREVLARKGRVVHSVTRDATVMDAVHVMNAEHIGSVLVLDRTEATPEGGSLAGIFTERDVLVRVLASGRDPVTTRVGDVMTADLHTLAPSATVAVAIRVMTKKRCRHLPVLRANGALLGLVSIGDLTKALTHSLREDVHTLESYIGGPYLA